jgi:carbon storage regulator
MLVLTRKSEEKIVIGKDEEDEIIITILKIQGDKVSIGIKAKKDTPIYRHELLSRQELLKKGKPLRKGDEDKEKENEEDEQ